MKGETTIVKVTTTIVKDETTIVRVTTAIVKDEMTIVRVTTTIVKVTTTIAKDAMAYQQAAFTLPCCSNNCYLSIHPSSSEI